MIREIICLAFAKALEQAQSSGRLALPYSGDIAPLVLTPALRREWGDFASPWALSLSASGGGSAGEIARALSCELTILLSGAASVAVAPGGFINISLERQLLCKALQELHCLIPDLEKVDTKETAESDCRPDSSPASPGAATAASVCSKQLEAIAKSKSFFAVQYAHAHLSALIRQVREPLLNTSTLAREPPRLSAEQLSLFQEEYRSNWQVFGSLFEKDAEVLHCTKRLIILLDEVQMQIAAAVSKPQRERLSGDLRELTKYVELFLKSPGIWESSLTLIRARLAVVLAAKTVLGNALQALGEVVPEHL